MTKRQLAWAIAGGAALTLLTIGTALAAHPAHPVLPVPCASLSCAGQAQGPQDWLAVRPGWPGTGATADETTLWSLVAGSLAWLVPIGFVLIAAGGMGPSLARQAALTGLAAIGLAVLGYWAVGFGIQLGGIGLTSALPGLEGLVWEWSALGPDWGPGWGMVGLRGWGLLNEAATPAAYALFFVQLPRVVTATLIPLLSLRGRTPTLASALGGLLMGGLIYPLAGNWIEGSGWLANLGQNLGLGHGLVDFGGAASVHLSGAAMALAGILVFCPRRPLYADAPPPDLPPVHLPLLAALGATLLVAGSLGWGYASPLLDRATVFPIRGVMNGLLAAAGGTLVPLAYTWFVAGRHDALMTARGVAAGAIAALAAGPFVPPWAALLIGAVAGLLVPLATYVVDYVLRLDDPTAVIVTHGLGAAWGLLAVALFADGLAGRGWNGIGLDRYLGVAGQGVTGLLAAVQMQPDWPGQIQAQIIGLAAVVLIPFFAATVGFAAIAALDQVWQVTHAPSLTLEPETMPVADPFFEAMGDEATSNK